MDNDGKDLFVKNALFRDYVSNYEALRSFFHWNPNEAHDWRKTISSIQPYPFHRSHLADILLRQNEAFGCGEKTLANIDLLKSDHTFAVITGQQAGLFTGPLLTIYKTITTIKLAEQLHERFKERFIPMFWVVSDDHDFAEVNHVFLVNGDNNVVKLELQTQGHYEKYSVGKIPLDEGFVRVLHDLSQHIQDTEFKDSILGEVREAYLGARSFADGFCRLMTKLFQDYGLVLVDPMDVELTKLALPIFQREIEAPLRSTSIVLQTGKRLIEGGYHQQIHLRPGYLNLFIEIDNRRCPVSIDNGTFHAEGSNFDCEAMLNLCLRSPERFSPNVVLRPILRSHLLPTIAYVGGPAEISYFAQLEEVFEAFNVPPPVIYPRALVTLVEGKVRRILEKYNVSLVHMLNDSDEVLRSLIEERLPEAFNVVFQEAEDDIEELFDRIREAVVPIDGSLEDIIIRSRKRLSHDVEKIEKKAIQAKKRSEEILVRQIHRTSTNLFPKGDFQERCLNILQFLILYGPEFIHHLFDAIDIDMKQHQVIDI